MIKLVKAEQTTNINFASSNPKLDSSIRAWRIPSASLVYPYNLSKADLKEG